MEEPKNKTNEQEIGGIKLIENTEKTTNNEIEKESQKHNEKIQIESLEQAKKEEQETISEIEKKHSIKIPIIISIIILIIITIFSTIFAVVNIGDTKIMKGISIGEIDVSNKTQEEVSQILNELCSAKADKQIYLKYGEFETTITYEALEVEYQIEKAITEAYDISRKGNILKNNFDILNTWINGKKIELLAVIDKDVINQIAQNINNNIDGAVVESSYYIENGKLIITSGQKGIKVDENKLLNEIYQVISTETADEQTIAIPVINAEPQEIDIEKIHNEVYKEVKDAYYTKEPFTIYPESDGIDFDIENAKAILTELKTEYEIPLIITKPTRTIKEIGTEAFPDLLTKFSTNYSASNVNRTINLQLAAKKINGTVLLPGEEFSYNKALGERTIQAGYKEAAVYSNGQVVNGLGGGICQISSTLYDAVVMANLKVTTRRNHQFVTSYLPAGKDATVVWGSQDFKFINTRNYPIRIEATVNGGVATIAIWGVKEDVEYDISIETKKIATIPYTTQYIQDPSLPVGTEQVKQAGSNGRKVEAYKVVKLNGKVISTTLLSKDTYNAMTRIVHVGTAGQ